MDEVTQKTIKRKKRKYIKNYCSVDNGSKSGRGDSGSEDKGEKGGNGTKSCFDVKF